MAGGQVLKGRLSPTHVPWIRMPSSGPAHREEGQKCSPAAAAGGASTNRSDEQLASRHDLDLQGPNYETRGENLVLGRTELGFWKESTSAELKQ